MKSYQVVICDEEVDYSFSLMNYINGEEDYPCLAVAFTDYPKKITLVLPSLLLTILH